MKNTMKSVLLSMISLVCIVFATRFNSRANSVIERSRSFKTEIGTTQMPDVADNETNHDKVVWGDEVSIATLVVFSGGEGTESDPYLISSLDDLEYLSEHSEYWDAYFKQTDDIDASETYSWNSGSGFDPIGWLVTMPDDNEPFTGYYDGNGKTINNLYINRGSEASVGLFGYINGATVKNLGMNNVDITGQYNTGSLFGTIYTGSTVEGCWATGTVESSATSGGFAGNNYNGTVSNCYTRVQVSGGSSSSYYAGGFLGFLNATLTNVYSTGDVSGGNPNGLVGKFSGGMVTSSYWDTEASNVATSTAGTGKTTDEMQIQSTYSDWDFSSTWSIDSSKNDGYPYLSWQAFPSLETYPVTSVYNSTAYCEGEITDADGKTFSTVGVCWNTSGAPTIADNKTTDGSETGVFSSALTGLEPETTYYVRTYATTTGGVTTYGNIERFSTSNMALDFDGTDDYVKVSDADEISILGDVSVELWANYSSLNSKATMLVKGEYGDQDSDYSTKNNYQYCFKLTTDKNLVAFWEYGTSGSNVEVISSESADIDANEWHHFAFVRNTSDKTVTFYCDGKQLGEVVAYSINPTLGDEGNLYIGSEYYAISSSPIRYPFAGSLDDIRIWNTTRSAFEIRENMMCSLSGNEDNLAAYYNFNQINNDSVPDVSLNGNDGALYNMDADDDWIDSEAYNTWLGKTGSDWATASNWLSGVPSSSDNVGIYKSAGGYELEISGEPTVNNMLVASSASPTLSSDIAVSGNLMLHADVDLNGNTITLGADGLLMEVDGSLYGDSGSVTTTRNLSNFSENVAGLGAYISTAADMGSTAITRGVSEHTVHNDTSVCRYFDIEPTNNSGLDATLIFNYLDRELNGSDEKWLALFKSDDDGANWTEVDATQDTVNNAFTVENIDGFSLWTAATPNDAPVANDDTDFKVYCGDTVSGNVLDNDEDAENNDIDVAVQPSLSVGTFDSFDLETGDFVYRAPLDFFGDVSFYYQATDGMVSDSARVNILVVDTITPIAAGKNLTVYLDEDGNASIQDEDMKPTYEYSTYVQMYYSNKIAINTDALEDWLGDAFDGSYISIDNSEKYQCFWSYDSGSYAYFYIDDNEETDDFSALSVFGASGNRSITFFVPLDNCGAVSISLSDSTFSCDDVGENEVWVTTTDSSQNSVDTMVTVTVADTIFPIAQAHDTTLYLGSLGVTTLSAEAINTNSYDNCAIDSMFISRDTFRSGDLGIQDIDFSLLDTYGNQASQTVQVNVLDTASPILAVPADTLIYVEAGECGVELSYGNECIDTVWSTSNNTGTHGVLQWQSFVAGKSGKLTKILLYKNGLGAADFNVSVYKGNGIEGDLLYSGNYSLAYSSNLWFDIDMTDGAEAVLEAGNTYTFALSGDDVNVIASKDNFYTAGDYYSSSYSSGVSSGYDLRFMINIYECICASDNSGDVQLKLTSGLPDSSLYPIGETINTYVAVDSSGNSTEKSFKITVVDSIAPEVAALDTTVYLDSEGIAVLTPAVVDDNSYDNCSIDTMYLSQDTFDCSDVAVSTESLSVLLSAEDASGNIDSDWFYVTVLDTIAPQVITKNITVYLDDAGTVTLDSLSVDNGTTDACGLSSFSVSPNNFGCENIGDNAVVLTVSDINGNVASAAATVTVADTIAPITQAHDTTLYLDAAGNVTLTAESVNNNSYDNCSIDTMYLSQDTLDCSDVAIPGGSLSVLLSAEDASGNIDSDWFYVTVLDTIAPQVITKNITVYLDDAGTVTLDSLSVDNGTTDACGLSSFSVSPNNFSCENIGDNAVVLTVSDINSNVASAAATVTIADTIFPIAQAHDTTLYLDAAGTVTLTAESVNNNSYDNCSIDTMYLSQDTFDCSDVAIPGGSLSVLLSAEDASGNIDSDWFYVTVLDTVAPQVITKNIVWLLGAEQAETITPAMFIEEAYDACGIDSLSISRSSFSGKDVGDIQLLLTATDVNGNQSEYSVWVTVEDTIAPTVSCQSFSIVLDEDGTTDISVASVEASAYDAGGIASYSIDKDKFDCSDIGENTVVLTVVDYAGNVATCSSTVTVLDEFSPIALCQNISVALDEQGVATITPEMLDAGSTDECGISEWSLSNTQFSAADLGENEVQLKVADFGGNADSCTATVTVIDTIAPELTCNPLTVKLVSGNYQLTDSEISALISGTSDNATATDQLLVEVAPFSFSCDDIGKNIDVEIKVSDESGNTSSCETTVFVDYTLETNYDDVSITLESGVCETTIDYPEVFSAETCAEMTLIAGLGVDGVFPIGTTEEKWLVKVGEITDTLSFTVEIEASNAEPTLDPVADVVVTEDESFTVLVSGISDGGDCEPQEITLSAKSTNTDLLDTIAVDYSSPNSTATLYVSPLANQNGEAEIVVLVEDEMGATTSDTFKVSVVSQNDAPVLVSPLEDQYVQAGYELDLSLDKTLGMVFDDADNDNLTWSFAVLETDTLPAWITIDETDDLYGLSFSPAATDTGCYTVVIAVEDQDGAGAADTFEVCVESVPLGVDGLETISFEVELYPNPTRGNVTVNLYGTDSESVEISVNNAYGAEVFRKEYHSTQGIKFDLAGEATGMYIVIIKTDNEQVVKKLILE